ncbi:MAG: hypothetical protein M1827_003720 [Pycnora praestabilis]|nr:MAG: hypothetical protein M1827_003720 [Pycnora praestabilis]
MPIAVVTLTPLERQADDFPFRKLTLTPESRTISVGRSSKSESKNLIAAQDNAWFNSAVMSREHASFVLSEISAVSKFVYLRDAESMHGTFQGNMQLSKDVKFPLKDGDTVRFGSEVRRGSETFPPQAFRVGIEWYDWRYETSQFIRFHRPPTPESKSSPREASTISGYSMPSEGSDMDEDDDQFREQSVEVIGATEKRGFSVPESDGSIGGEDELDNIGMYRAYKIKDDTPILPKELSLVDDTASHEIIDEFAKHKKATTEITPTAQVALTPTLPEQMYVATGKPIFSNKTGAVEDSQEAGSSQNPMVIDDDVERNTTILVDSDDEGPEVQPVRSQKINATNIKLPDLAAPNSGASLSALSHDEDSEGSEFDIEEAMDESSVEDESDLEDNEMERLLSSNYSDSDDMGQILKAGRLPDYEIPSAKGSFNQFSAYQGGSDVEDSDFSLIEDCMPEADQMEDERALNSSRGLQTSHITEHSARMAEAAPATHLTKPAPSAVLVEDSQSQITNPARIAALAPLLPNIAPKLSTTGTLEISQGIGARAPSPSDAAMAKTTAARHQSKFDDEQAISQRASSNILESSYKGSESEQKSDHDVLSIMNGKDHFTKIPGRSTKTVTFAEDGSYSAQTFHDYHGMTEFSEARDANGNLYQDGPFSKNSVPHVSNSPAPFPNQFYPFNSTQYGTETYENSLIPQPINASSYALEFTSSSGLSSNPFIPETQDLSSMSYGSTPLHIESEIRYSSSRPHMTQLGCPAQPSAKSPIWKAANATTPENSMQATLAMPKPTSRVSISDIVEPTTSEIISNGGGSKRKADEISSLVPDEQPWTIFQQNTVTAAATESLLQDAQPRDPTDVPSQISLLDSRTSSRAGIQEASQSISLSQVEPPKKRAKTSSFKSLAATAFASAVIGGMGVFATLLALPEDA